MSAVSDILLAPDVRPFAIAAAIMMALGAIELLTTLVGFSLAEFVGKDVADAREILRFCERGPAETVMKLLDSIEGDGLEIGAIYHSHTRTAPYPSQTDINFAVNWPGVEWIIVGLADPSAPEIRSYLIEKGTVREVEIGQIAA